MYSTFFTGTGTRASRVGRHVERESRDWQGAQTCLQEELILAFTFSVAVKS